MVVVSRRKPTLRHLTARLLVLGDKQVGKSASIVRYTTGRFIEEYCGSTNDWLYKHSLGFDSKRNVSTSVELFEQKDIQFSNSSNLQATSSTSLDHNNNNNTNKQPQIISLSSRVALDRQIDNELHEKQQMLNKLRWANAYIVIYAIHDISTFNKAIKYLNLIANNINSPQGSRNNSYSGSNSFNSSNNISNSSNNINCSGNSEPASNSIGGKFFNILSPGLGGQEQSFGAFSKHSPGNHHHHHANNSPIIKRPILLLANKRDLDKGGIRQVTAADGRLLAMRHQAMFAEISISESNKYIENILNTFIEQIDPACLNIEHVSASPSGSEVNQKCGANEATLIHLRLPTVELSLKPSSLVGGIHSSTPVWGSLVKLKPVGSIVVQSSKVSLPRLQASEVRLLKPLRSDSGKPNEIVAKSAAISTKSPMTARGLTSSFSRDSNESSSLPSKGNTNTKSNNNNQQGHNQNRYAYLKSSFKRASMAIVSSKALTKGTKMPKERRTSEEGTKIKSGSEQQLVSQSSKRSSLESTSPKAIDTQQHKTTTTNWIRNHMRLSRDSSQAPSNSSDPKLNSSALSDTVSGGSESGRPSKKPVFKYETRRRTVAFEEIGANECVEGVGGCINLVGPQTNIGEVAKLSSETSLLANNTRSVRALSSGSFDRSSSSLHTPTDSCSSPQPILWGSERAPSSVGSASVCSSNLSTNNSHQPTTANGQQNSLLTLSRASTCGGSYEDSGDEDGTFKDASNSLASPNVRDKQTPLGSTTILLQHNSKKRYQLVKSVQNTLTNLTRSSNTPAQAAKRSICNSLFKYSIQSPSVKTITPLATDLAKTEQIQPIVGFCN